MFSKKLNDAQRKYSTYDRELLAIYLAIRNFRKMFEGKEITVFTDHKPLTFALTKQTNSTETPLRTRYIHYISQFASEIKHLDGNENTVADSLSRIEDITTPSPVDYSQLQKCQEQDSNIPLLTRNQKLKFEYRITPHTANAILCETSTGTGRPVVPEQLRKDVFNALHNLCHPGIRATRKMITQRFFWPKMNTDINQWSKNCIDCQKTKVYRHTTSPLEKFHNSERLAHIHVDIVGPLPISEGKRYCITIIDRETKWPEVFPVEDINAETVAKTIFEGWITRFGCPERITSDQGRQFESQIFTNIMKRMGIEKTRTTAYHPQSNGIVERFHRTLKSALTARLNQPNWTQEIPVVLLGLRAVPKNNTDISAAQALYGKTLRLPGEMLEESKTNSASSYENVITEAINKLRASEKNINRQQKNIFVNDHLYKCTHVFIRNDGYKKPLTPTYDGPHRVLQRQSKYFTIQVRKRNINVSIDRLKPAFIINNEGEESTNSDLHLEITQRSGSNIQPARLSDAAEEGRESSNIISRSAKYYTRSGRAINRPRRFAGGDLCNIRRDVRSTHVTHQLNTRPRPQVYLSTTRGDDRSRRQPSGDDVQTRRKTNPYIPELITNSRDVYNAAYFW